MSVALSPRVVAFLLRITALFLLALAGFAFTAGGVRGPRAAFNATLFVLLMVMLVVGVSTPSRFAAQ